jgi:hypothetical protein
MREPDVALFPDELVVVMEADHEDREEDQYRTTSQRSA